MTKFSIFKARVWWRAWWPVSRNEYNRVVEAGRAYAAGVRKEKEDYAKQVDELVRKLIRVSVTAPIYGQFQVAVMISDDLIYKGGFIHGADQVAIRMLAERIGHEVERELRTINFSRIRSEGYFNSKPGLRYASDPRYDPGELPPTREV